MLTPTPGLVLDYLPLSGGARLVRVYGEQPCITLPEALPAAQSGTPALPLTELGGYCFSETLRDPPPASALCRCTVQPDGALRLTRVFGHALPGEAGRGRYSFDFDAPDVSPAPAMDELHPICGRFLEELTLPDALRVIGSCAFYNCRALRRLSIGSAILTTGSDVFLNDFALTELAVRAAPSVPTGLFALVNRITSSVRAVFQPEGNAAPMAALWYPEYWEDYEETPAHVLLHTFSGQGYHYRQCFLNNAVLWAEYDAVFPQGHDADDAATMAMLCLDRLRFPYLLGDAAAQEYRAFLASHTLLVLQKLLKAQDLDALRALLALNVMDAAAFAEAAALAAKSDFAEAAALLADAEHRLHAAGSRRKRYDFDF